MEQRGPTRIVILGAGFGGVAAARTLARLLPEPGQAQITLVDQNNFFLFTPMLTEIASGEVDARHVINPLRRFSSRIRFEQGRVDGVDLTNKRVTLTLERPDDEPERKTLEADHLILALGSVSNYHHLSGLEDHSLTMKSLGDAVALRNVVIALLERADAEDDPDKRRELLTVVVAGGGFSGVETMAALNDYLRSSRAYYPRVRPADLKMMIVHPGDRLLPEISPKLASYAQKKLEARGVEVLLNTKVSSAGTGYVELEGGRRIATHTLVWTAGVTPSPVIAALDCRKGQHGGVVVDECLQVPDHPGIWALGDCAEIPRGEGAKPGSGKTYAPTAQNATREGSLVARNIVAVMRGEVPSTFRYRPLGELALIGRRTGVAQVYGLRFSGLPAWAMWRVVYLAKLPRLAKKVRVALDWVLDLAFGRDISSLPMQRSVATGGAAGPPQASGS